MSTYPAFDLIILSEDIGGGPRILEKVTDVNMDEFMILVSAAPARI